jgi:3-hydroxybutyryl-CoA dehydrogenase
VVAKPIKRVLVVGYGVMGRGIARSFAGSGFETVIWSRRAAALTDLPAGARAVATLPAEAPDLVLETIAEERDAKAAIYAQVEAAYPGDVVIATNTSGLPLEDLAAGLKRPENFVGIHYFQPAEIFPMVEVVAGPVTTPDVLARAADAIRGTGKEPIVLRKPIVGFLINRLQHAILHEAYHLVSTGVVGPAEIDKVAKHMLGPRMCITGLIEQKDISGLEIHAKAQQSIVPALAHTNVPNPIVQNLARRGELGLASGRGFYDWTGCDRSQVARQASERLTRLLDFLDREIGPGAPGTMPKTRPVGR